MNETKIIDGVVFQILRIGNQNVMRRWTPENYKWIESGWANRQPRFNSASKMVDSLFLSSDNQILNEKITSFEKQVRSGKAKPEILFTWSLSVLRGSQIFLWNHIDADEKLREAAAFLSLSDNHKYFDFYRLRFLIEARAFPNKPHIIAGKKILSASSNEDLAVLLRTSATMSLIGNSEEKKESLAIAKKLYQRYPMSTTYCSHLGRVYRQIWFDTNDETSRLRAISQYKKYLTIAPPSDPWRANCTQILKQLLAKEKY
jgi:hypothetical protein